MHGNNAFDVLISNINMYVCFYSCDVSAPILIVDDLIHNNAVMQQMLFDANIHNSQLSGIFTNDVAINDSYLGTRPASTYWDHNRHQTLKNHTT